MIVILKKDIKGTGKAGDVVKVSDGYARNMLLPKGYAVEATDGNIRSLEKQKAVQAQKEADEKAAAEKLAAELAEKKVVIRTKAGEGGRLSLILPADVRISSLRAAASFGFRPFRTIFVKTTPAKEPKRVISEFSREQLVESQETIILMTDGARSQQYSLLTREFYLDSSQIGQFCHK